MYEVAHAKLGRLFGILKSVHSKGRLTRQITEHAKLKTSLVFSPTSKNIPFSLV